MGGSVGIGSRNGRARAALVQGALELMARRGYHGATVSELAAAAGASRNQLFHYFPTKEALALAALREGMDGLRAANGHALRPPGLPAPLAGYLAGLSLQRDSLPPLLAAETAAAMVELGGRIAPETLALELGRAALGVNSA